VKVKVRFFTVLREMAGKREEELTVRENTKVREVLDLLSKTYGDEFSDYLFEGEELRDYIQILLNGINIMTLDGLETRLREDSVLAIVPPVGGGTQEKGKED